MDSHDVCGWWEVLHLTLYSVLPPHVTLYRVLLPHLTLYCVLLPHLTLCCVLLLHRTLCRVLLPHRTLCHVLLPRLTLCRVLPPHLRLLTALLILLLHPIESQPRSLSKLVLIEFPLSFLLALPENNMDNYLSMYLYISIIM